jgi:hypothetical protein
MGKNRQQSGLVNVISYDVNNNVSLTSSPSSSIQTSGSVVATSITGSFTGSVFGIGNTATFSSSVNNRVSSIETVTASNIARITSLESFSSSIYTTNTFTTSANTRLTELENKTGSLASTGSNTFYGNQIISGTTWIAGDFIVQGSSSIQYISASSVSIGTNVVNLNTANPAVRYGGISVQDSGSANGVTGSMLWDSTCNRWIYSNPSGVGYSGGVLMSGPRAATLGTETTLTCNYVAKSGGGDHLYDSCIIDDGTTVCVNANLKGSGTACFANSVCGLGIAAGTSGIRSSGNLVFPANLATYCIWNEGYGGGIQLRRSDATTDRYARIGIVNDTGVWVSGMTIDGSTAFAKFDAGICTAGGACLSKILVNSVTDDAASALQVKVLAANATSARIASTTNNNLFSFISNGTQGHSILDMGRCTESGTFAAGYIRLRTDGDSWIQGGCMGIGTSTPTQRLTVNQGATGTGQGIPSTTGTSQCGILRLRPAVGLYGETMDFGMNVSPTYAWIQSTNADGLGTNYCLILNPNGGSVGINCTSPSKTLTVNGCIGMSNTYNWGVTNDNDTNWGFRVCTSSGNYSTFISYAGDQGSDRRGGIYNSNGHWVGYGNCMGHFIVQCNLGVGTSSPGYKLDVSGTVYSSAGFYSPAYFGAGYSTLTAGSGTGTAIFDTITRNGVGLYEVALVANANAGGATYYDFYYGRLLIGTGYSGAAVTDYLVWCQESAQPRTLYGSGGGNLTINVCMYQSSVESSCIGTGGSYTIRFKIAGYNSNYTGAGTTIFLKRII